MELPLHSDLSLYNASLIEGCCSVFIMSVVILNTANMIFGFINYKKKWWYYLILMIGILFLILLHDYYAIEFKFEPFD